MRTGNACHSRSNRTPRRSIVQGRLTDQDLQGLVTKLVTTHSGQRFGTSQIARLIRCDRRTPSRYCSTGVWPASKQGKLWKVHAKDLVAWIETHRAPAPEDPGRG